tara:strand:+ start:2123 stop:2764 length:642 start_codon:yes stop_codon:yes gene_type:complete
MIKQYKSIKALATVIPIFPLTGAVLFPRCFLPLNIFETRYLAMINDALESGNRLIGMIQPKNKKNIYSVGCLGKINSFEETEDGRFFIILKGITRFKVEQELKTDTSYRKIVANYDQYQSDLVETNKLDLEKKEIIEFLKKNINFTNWTNWETIEKSPAENIINYTTMFGALAPEEKQLILEAEELKKRMELLKSAIHINSAQSESSSYKTLQ